MDSDMEILVMMMADELGRIPTEQEVLDFIYGDEDIRRQILRGSKR
jgi:hypothetical protein